MSKEAMKLRVAAEKVVELCSERPLSLGKWFIDMSEACESLREALAHHTEQPLDMVAEQHKPYRPLQDNGSKYFGAWDKADQALNRMADNARELGLDYEPDGMHHNKPQKRPQNCGTGYCSCIECVMEPAQEPAPLRDAIVANLVREGINKHKARELADHFVGLTTAPAWVSLTDEEIDDIYQGVGRNDLMLVREVEAKLREKNATAQPAVPDALTIADKESADYHEGWNDCRALMLEMRKP